MHILLMSNWQEQTLTLVHAWARHNPMRTASPCELITLDHAILHAS